VEVVVLLMKAKRFLLRFQQLQGRRAVVEEGEIAAQLVRSASKER
jgi:hypothetical protein